MGATGGDVGPISCDTGAGEVTCGGINTGQQICCQLDNCCVRDGDGNETCGIPGGDYCKEPVCPNSVDVWFPGTTSLSGGQGSVITFPLEIDATTLDVPYVRLTASCPNGAICLLGTDIFGNAPNHVSLGDRGVTSNTVNYTIWWYKQAPNMSFSVQAWVGTDYDSTSICCGKECYATRSVYGMSGGVPVVNGACGLYGGEIAPYTDPYGLVFDQPNYTVGGVVGQRNRMCDNGYNIWDPMYFWGYPSDLYPFSDASGWWWYCYGQGGGDNALCSANKAPVNASCGTAARTYSIFDTSYGSDTFCATGTLDGSTPSFPANPGDTVTWNCSGLYGGAPTSCSASQGVVACPATPSSYPTDSWDRVWCDHSFNMKLADVPDEPIEQFNTDWGTGLVGGIRSDDIGFRSGRTINIPALGTYIFSVGSDDGVRVWIDGNLVDDHWYDRGYIVDTFSATLTAGNHQVRMDYYENGGGAHASFSYTATPPQAPSLALNSGATGCVGGLPQIALNYGANIPPAVSRIELYRDGSLVSTDNSPTASPGSEIYTDDGVVSGQSYTYSARAYTSAGASSPLTSTGPYVAANCLPNLSVNTQLRAVNGSTTFKLRDIKDGDILSFRITFLNNGTAPATLVDNTTTLTSNLSYIGNSYSCASKTSLGQNMHCVPNAIGTPGASSLVFRTNDPLNAGDSFTADFRAEVVTFTTQLKELMTIRSQGTYLPGSSSFDVIYSLLATPSSEYRPNFHEIAP
ncbi:MAG: PA14 domain-containing protein [Patescibacteria group bacterium]|nr:PA14 domain-containing protein [Patescibacteria group bacterium]